MKLRHFLKAYHTLPDFPRCDDILFEISQNPKYANGETFAFTNMKECLTFKINKTDWEIKMKELVEEGLVEKIKTNYRIKL